MKPTLKRALLLICVPSIIRGDFLSLKEQGLDGIECYQACHNKDDVSFALELAKNMTYLSVPEVIGTVPL